MINYFSLNIYKIKKSIYFNNINMNQNYYLTQPKTHPPNPPAQPPSPGPITSPPSKPGSNIPTTDDRSNFYI